VGYRAIAIMEDGPENQVSHPPNPRAKTRRSLGKATAGETSRRRFGMMTFRTMRERGMGKGASLSNEIVLADSGRAGEVAAGVGRVSRETFSTSC